MRTVKLFSKKEIEENVENVSIVELTDFYESNGAVPWYVDYEEFWEDYTEEDKRLIITQNRVNDYLITNGAEEGELIYIDMFY